MVKIKQSVHEIFTMSIMIGNDGKLMMGVEKIKREKRKTTCAKA